MAAVAIEPSVARVSDDYSAQVLAGISNQGRTQQQPYVTAGDRTYLIGTQDGNFPPMGHHVPGEMGGLWLPPIKLIDGFQARIAELGTNKEILLAESAPDAHLSLWKPLPLWPGAGRSGSRRFQFTPDQRPGMIIQYRLRTHPLMRDGCTFNGPSRQICGRVGIRITDAGSGTVRTSSIGIRTRIFIAKDTDNPWFCVWGGVLPPPMRGE